MNGHGTTRQDRETARARLSALIDGALDTGEAAQVDAHLEECAECRAVLAQLRATVRLVREVEPVQVPEGFAAAVRGRVEQLANAAPRPGWARLRALVPTLRWSWKTAAVAASVALVAIFAANLVREVVPVSLGLRSEEREGADRGSSARDAQRAGEPAAKLENRRVARPATAPAPEEATRSGTEAPAAQSNVGQAVDAAALRRVIRTGQLAIEVEKFDDAARRLLEIAEGAGGFVADSSYAEDDGIPRGTFVLRTPAGRFGEVVRKVETLGTVQRRQVSGQDVTEEFIDVEARVRNMERHETRLLAFMDRATKIPDLMAIEQEVARVRGEIERLTGRLRYLSNRVDLATVQVEVSQKSKKKTGGFWDFDQTLTRIQAAFLNTLRQILGATERLAAFAAALLPIALLGALGWAFLRRMIRRPDSAV
ncbi:MAG: DUF4349 domain-containing protein [bacterium]